jgi:hypothetical protein
MVGRRDLKRRNRSDPVQLLPRDVKMLRHLGDADSECR